MKVVLDGYENKKICVAVSGGKDSMALLHFLFARADEYGITLSALNCDHKIRGEASARDSAFVRDWCLSRGIPLIFFERENAQNGSEQAARSWRLSCYSAAKNPLKNGENIGLNYKIFSKDGNWQGADAVATAHHLNDNAETVLFNLARGSALSGMTGISFESKSAGIIRPLISASREEIDSYIAENNIPYVEDETNFTDVYSRNKIRLNVLPELEEIAHGAAKNIYRFSRLAAEDEDYFKKIIAERNLVQKRESGYAVAFCEERVIFRRAVVCVLEEMGKKDYTFAQVQRLYELQFSKNGKRFCFLNLTAYKEGDKIFISQDGEASEDAVAFNEYVEGRKESFNGEYLKLSDGGGENKPFKALKFDMRALPRDCEVRFMREGDRFKKFGGGTKNLGDYFTDLKIPVRVRGKIPLIASGNEVLIVCGVEISDSVKITSKTTERGFVICKNYRDER